MKRVIEVPTIGAFFFRCGISDNLLAISDSSLHSLLGGFD